ncbi:hypothetical protein ACSVC9_11300 [Clostridium sp. LBM24168]
MESSYPWILNINNFLWKIYLDYNNSLLYRIMQEENKWSKEKIIDTEVTKFTICVESEIVHIIYLNKNNEIKYCTNKEGKWFGKIIYLVEENGFTIEDLKTVILNGEMHLFYLLVASGSSKRGILKHCAWNGIETKIYTVQHIVLSDKIEKYYEVLVEKNKFIHVFFLSDSGNEISLNYCQYGNSWTTAQRLYGLQGNNILFKILYVNNGFEIINDSKDGTIYSLDHVHIEDNIDMKEYKIYKGEIEPTDPIIFYVKSKIYICWKEKEDIFCSNYKLGKWSESVCLDKEPEMRIKIFNFIQTPNSETANMIYAAENEHNEIMHLFSFEELSESITKKQSKVKNNKTLNIRRENESIEEIQEKFRNIFYENSILKEKIDSFSIHMQKKKQITDEYKNRIAKVVEQKKRLEENCKFFMEVKENIQKELNETRQQLENQRKTTKSIKYKLEQKDKSSKELKDRIDFLSEENKRLREELDLERKLPLLKKLFKRKDNDI